MEYDIIIVGAGPAGLSFARSLAGSGLRIAIVEKQPATELAAPGFDGRDIALTHLSVRILKDLGIWARFASDERPPIRSAKVLDGTSPYCLDFSDLPQSVDALGYIVSNHVIRQALYAEICTVDDIELLPELAVTAIDTDDRVAAVTLSDGRVMESRLIVAADSRFSETRRMAGIPASMHDFGRVCIVCRMEHEKDHDGVAFECFHYRQTLAVLPLTPKVSSIVVTAPMHRRDPLMSMGEAAFADDVRRRFESRLGDMRLAGERFAYPLVGVHAARFHATRVALIGDAAVGMHPVTAHGYNLGLSGQDILAREIVRAAARQRDIATTSLLERYQRRHMRTTRPMYHGTNGIVKFFTDDRMPARFARTTALRLANRLPPIKRVIRNKLTATSNRSGLLPPAFARPHRRIG